MLCITWLSETIGVYWLLFTTILCLYLYKSVFKTWNYFTERNVKFNRGIPIFGSQFQVLLGRKHFSGIFADMYKQFPNENVTGFFNVGGAPGYIIRDPELIKQITIKDFDHFLNHSFDIHEEADPMFGRSLFIMKDQRWRNMRATLSPAFTGSRMRLMFGLIAEVSQTYFEYLRSCDSVAEYEAQDMCARYANDAIATCAFGLTVNSMKDRDNEFYQAGQKMSEFGGLSMIKFMGYSMAPWFMDFFQIPLLNAKSTKYFKRMILDNISYREQNGIVRNDMVNILIEAKKGTLTGGNSKEADAGYAELNNSDDDKLGSVMEKWTDDDLVAQSVIFFLAGFSTVSLTMAFTLYELAINPHIQERLHDEIAEIEVDLAGKPLNYETLQKMKYMDMVLNESMRRWPQSPANDRIVTKPYLLHDPNGNEFLLNKGDAVWIPVSGIHLDPKYYPEPEKFDPERFSDENRENIVSGTFMPFGIGPRSCIANRFALMECKAFLFYLFSNFVVKQNAKTPVPMKLKPTSGNVESESGIWITLVARTK